MAGMNGYVIHDWGGPSVSGWALGAVRARAHLDGVQIGEAELAGSPDPSVTTVEGAQTFEMPCTRSFTPLDVMSGRMVVVAEAANGETFTLRLTESRRLDVAARAIDEVLAKVPEPARRPVRQEALSWPLSAADQLAASMDRGYVSPQIVPANLRSADGSVVTGMGGHLFYIGKDASLLPRYRPDGFDLGAEGMSGFLTEWQSVLDERRSVAERYGAKYVHLVVPEKYTALRRYSPIRVPGPTVPFSAYRERFSSDWHPDLLALWETWQRPEEPYLTTDSHLSAAGAQAVTAAVADCAAPHITPRIEAIPLTVANYVQGDLSVRMQLPFYSRAMRPDPVAMFRMSEGLEEVSKTGEHTRGRPGRVLHWKNSTAATKMRLLIFGDSMCGDGDQPEDLAWWLKHAFGEVRLEWRADMGQEAVEAFKPDVIVTQTMERDITAVPVR